MTLPVWLALHRRYGWYKNRHGEIEQLALYKDAAIEDMRRMGIK